MYEQVWGTEEGREGGEQDRRRGWRVQRCHRTGGGGGVTRGSKVEQHKGRGREGKRGEEEC